MHETLGVFFRTFQLCRRTCGTKNFQLCVTKGVDDTGREWYFRPDNGEPDLFVAGKFDQCRNLGDVDVLDARFVRRARIARRHEDARHAPTLQ